jgi:hypothetical protein
MSFLGDVFGLIVGVSMLLFVLALLLEPIHELTGYLLKVMRRIEKNIEFHKWHHPWQRELKKKKKAEEKAKAIDPEWQREFIEKLRTYRKEFEEDKRRKGNTK